MKKRLQGFILGILVCSLFLSLPVFATSITKNIKAVFNSVTVSIDGKKITGDKFIYNKKTYVDINVVSDLIGKDYKVDKLGNISFNSKQIIKTTYPNNYQEITYLDGSKYVGEVLNGKRNGFGSFFYTKNDKNLRDRYDGQWINDKRDGYGTLTWKDGTSTTSLDWNKDDIDGYMIQNFIDGYYNCVYMSNGIKQKVGIFDNKTSLMFGEISNDKLNGHGVYFDADGKKYFVEYDNNAVKDLVLDINSNINTNTTTTIPSNNNSTTTTTTTTSPTITSTTNNNNDEYIRVTKSQYEKELADYATQIENTKKNLSVQVLKKQENGEFQYEYTYDQSKVDSLQSLYDKKLSNFNAWKALWNVN